MPLRKLSETLAFEDVYACASFLEVIWLTFMKSSTDLCEKLSLKVQQITFPCLFVQKSDAWSIL